MDKNNIKFNKYDSKANYNKALEKKTVDNATFSVVRTKNCNSNDNNNNSGDVKDLYISDTKLTDVYNSRKVDNNDELTTTVGVGGIPAGTKLSDLTQMPLGEILDKMFFKVYIPRVKKNVGVSLSYSPLDWKVNSTFSELGSSNINIDKGKFEIEQDGTFVECGDLSLGLDSFSVSYTPSNRVVVNGTNKITATIKTKGGNAPKNSEGKDVDSLKYNGETFTKSITLYPYYEWYATSCDGSDYTVINTMSKQNNVRSMGCSTTGNVVVNICGGDAEHPQRIKVPGTIVNCEAEILGNFQSYSFDSEWEIVGTEVENGRNYNIYEYKSSHFADGSASGFKIRFKVNP